MRGGQIAIVKRAHDIIYRHSGTGKDQKFPIWIGECECCHSPMTWNENGTFAAAGQHQFDLIGKAGK